MSTFLVTGCAGFIGSHTTELLLRLGHNVFGFDSLNSAYDVGLKKWRLDYLLSNEKFGFACVDITDSSTLNDAFTNCIQKFGKPSGIIHLAAYAGVRYSVENPWIYYQTNVLGTLNILDACLKNDIKKLVFASSSSLYGENASGPFREEDNTDRPLSPYAASKKAAEELCYSYHHLHGVDVTALRFFTVYGLAGRPDMSPFRFVQWIYEGIPLTLYGDGSQVRDFTHVGDISHGVYAALKPMGYEVINLGNDKPIAVLEFINKIEKAIGQKAVIVQRDAHMADVSATWASIDKARKKLNWSPKVTIDEGIDTLVSWYRANRAFAKSVDV